MASRVAAGDDGAVDDRRREVPDSPAAPAHADVVSSADEEDEEEDDDDVVERIASQLRARVAKLLENEGLADEDHGGTGSSSNAEDSVSPAAGNATSAALAALRRRSVAPEGTGSANGTGEAGSLEDGERTAAGAAGEITEQDLLAQARTALQANQTYQRALHQQLYQLEEAQRANLHLQVTGGPLCPSAPARAAHPAWFAGIDVASCRTISGPSSARSGRCRVARHSSGGCRASAR